MKPLLEQIMKLEDIALDTELVDYFAICIEQINKAIDWQSALIESAVDSTVNRIEQLEIRAENLILEGEKK